MGVPSPQQRLQLADRLSETQGWQRKVINAPPFILSAFLPADNANQSATDNSTLTVYIEGDGLAWVSQSRTSSDPTPVDPIGLRLALQHPVGKVAYLARPCQYTNPQDASNCNARFWTSARFAPEVISASDTAISRLQEMTGSTSLRLVGYSGGGAIAALVAARRSDVIQLITVAGNLEHETWTRHHRISPLKNSLNPVDFWKSLEDIPQVHLVGDQDQIVGVEVLSSYLRRFPAESKIKTIHLPTYSHKCCWEDNWQELYLQATGLDRKE